MRIFTEANVSKGKWLTPEERRAKLEQRILRDWDRAIRENRQRTVDRFMDKLKKGGAR
jgi:hypothetical protein